MTGARPTAFHLRCPLRSTCHRRAIAVTNDMAAAATATAPLGSTGTAAPLGSTGATTLLGSTGTAALDICNTREKRRMAEKESMTCGDGFGVFLGFSLVPQMDPSTQLEKMALYNGASAGDSAWEHEPLSSPHETTISPSLFIVIVYKGLFCKTDVMETASTLLLYVPLVMRLTTVRLTSKRSSHGKSANKFLTSYNFLLWQKNPTCSYF